jgi:hypothetical protein
MIRHVRLVCPGSEQLASDHGVALDYVQAPVGRVDPFEVRVARRAVESPRDPLGRPEKIADELLDRDAVGDLVGVGTVSGRVGLPAEQQPVAVIHVGERRPLRGQVGAVQGNQTGG